MAYAFINPATDVMICSRCFHINAITNPVCEKCRHDAGTPVSKSNAENLRSTLQRINGGGGPDPDAVAKLDAFFKAPRRDG